MTSSASRKRSSPELSAQCTRCIAPSRTPPQGGDDRNRTGVAAFAELCLTTRPRRHMFWRISDGTPFCGFPSMGTPTGKGRPNLRAEDGARTRDLNLGKVTLYRLSYFRVRPPV